MEVNEEKRKQQVITIINLALKINNEKENTIFFNYSGHVKLFEIEIYYDGWEKDKGADYRGIFYLNTNIIDSIDVYKNSGVETSPEKIIKKLKELERN